MPPQPTNFNSSSICRSPTHILHITFPPYHQTASPSTIISSFFFLPNLARFNLRFLSFLVSAPVSPVRSVKPGTIVERSPSGTGSGKSTVGRISPAKRYQPKQQAQKRRAPAVWGALVDGSRRGRGGLRVDNYVHAQCYHLLVRRRYRRCSLRLV